MIIKPIWILNLRGVWMRFIQTVVLDTDNESHERMKRSDLWKLAIQSQFFSRAVENDVIFK